MATLPILAPIRRNCIVYASLLRVIGSCRSRCVTIAVDMNGETTTTTAARPEYTVRAVAERLGVPVPTLRSWTRRYGIGPGEHRPGTHRTYTEADIAVLERMVGHIAAGASPSSAAAVARSGSVASKPLDVESIVAAAHRLDAADLLATLSEHFTTHGVVTTWESLCRPAFAEIVREQAAAGGCIDVEHVLSWAVITSLHRVPVASAPISVLLACAEHELHTMPLEVLRAALAERSVQSVVLGSVPPAALTDALRRAPTRTVVVLWANSSDTADAEVFRAADRPGTRIFVAGTGWEHGSSNATPLYSLPGAVDAIARAVSDS